MGDGCESGGIDIEAKHRVSGIGKARRLHQANIAQA